MPADRPSPAMGLENDLANVFNAARSRAQEYERGDDYDRLIREYAEIQRDVLAVLRRDTDAERLRSALEALIHDIEDTVDCDLQGEDWRCTVQYDKAMLDRARQALTPPRDPQ